MTKKNYANARLVGEGAQNAASVARAHANQAQSWRPKTARPKRLDNRENRT